MGQEGGRRYPNGIAFSRTMENVKAEQIVLEKKKKQQQPGTDDSGLEEEESWASCLRQDLG